MAGLATRAAALALLALVCACSSSGLPSGKSPADLRADCKAGKPGACAAVKRHDAML